MRVLFLVDDEPSILSALRRELTRCSDHECHLFDSAEAALDALEETVPDAVISDQRMTGMSGSEFLAMVRNRYPGVVRVLTSAHATPENEGDTIAHFFLEKPWDRARLVEMNETIEEIRRACERPIEVETEALPAARLRPQNAAPHRILVLHSDVHAASSLARGLSGGGFDVVTADSVGDGKELLLAHRIALVVIDLQDRAEVGAKFCQFLKARDGIRTIPVVATATHREGDAFEICRALGADGYLQKPFTFEEITNLTRRFLSMRGRSAESLPTEIEASLADDDDLTDVVARLSSSEILVHSARRIPVGSPITVKLAVPSLLAPIRVGGEVAWVQRYPLGSNDATYGIGIALSDGPAGRSKIRALIREFADRPRVVILDDDRLILRMAREAFMAAGFAVFAAETCERAIDLAREVDPVAIVLDLLVNGATSVGVVKALRRAPATATVPIVIHSGRPAYEASRIVAGLNVDGYVRKERDFSPLVEKVSSLARAKAEPASVTHPTGVANIPVVQQV
ncbi:MAG: response regulator [Deltaproteobacteria bacterium]|nr:response regulator [Deltaproteobacteria bacterium]